MQADSHSLEIVKQGQRLAKLRKAKGLTTSQLAE